MVRIKENNNMAERVGRAKAIRLKCLDCCAGQAAEVRKCPAVDCLLWRFRMGREIRDEDTSFSDDFEDEELILPTILKFKTAWILRGFSRQNKK